MLHGSSTAAKPSRRGGVVKVEPPTGGTTLTTPSTGTQSRAEEPANPSGSLHNHTPTVSDVMSTRVTDV
jgi:hypothetical protein